jgi:hypothetical protein
MFLLVSCQSAVTKTLQGIVAAAQIAVTVLTGLGVIPPPLAALLNDYLSAVLTGAINAAAILANTTLTALQKADEIAAEFAMIVVPILPPGTAVTIVNDIAAVAAAVENFLGNIHLGKALALTHPEKAIVLTNDDIKALPKIKANAIVVLMQLKQLKLK